MLLAERLRTPEEKRIVQEAIENQLKITIDVNELYFGQKSAARLMLSGFNQENSAPSERSKRLSSIEVTGNEQAVTSIRISLPNDEWHQMQIGDDLSQ